jgi:catechol 2,3-dioxygenase-like lactoylglutathione lyase family enzyme
MPSFSGLTHVALTVRDVSASRPWYRALLGVDPIIDVDTGEFINVMWAFGDGTIFGLHQHTRHAPDEQFDEFRVGLDHVSFGVENRAELEKWMDRLDELHVPHGGIGTSACPSDWLSASAAEDRGGHEADGLSSEP